MRVGLPVALAGALALGACAVDDSPAARGKRVYLGQCIACHNSDPSRDGPLGPAVKGSSRTLLEAKLLRGEYPPGYTPKRDSHLMPPQPELAPNVTDLAAFLEQ